MTSRTRSRGSLSSAEYHVLDYSDLGLLQSDVKFSSATKSNGNLETVSDYNNGNFREKSARGVVMMSPCSISKTNRLTRPDGLDFGPLTGWGARRYRGEMAAAWAVAPSVPSWYATRIVDWKYETVVRAHAQIASSEFQGLVTLAEAGKTATTIARPFGAALDLLKKINDRRLSLIKRGLSPALAAAKAWLEYRLGWKPLLYDIQGIFDAYTLATSHHAKPVRKVARASGDVSFTGVQTYSGVPSGLTGLNMARDFDYYCQISSGVLYELTDEGQADAGRRHAGTRLSDVPEAIWEAIPYSWLVDRFLNVGNWLKAIVPRPGVSILGSWTVTREKQLCSHTIVEAWVSVTLSGKPTVRLSDSGGTYLEETSMYTREINPSLPISPFTYNPKELSLQQSLDHCALIVDKIYALFKS